MNFRMGPSIRPDQPSFGMPWEMQLLDLERYRPQAVFRRFRTWVAATRRRRWTAWILIALFVLFVFPGLVGAVSTAQNSTATPGVAPNSALGWMDIKDSSGVQLSSYMFVSNHGSVWSLDIGRFVVWALIILFFAIWHIMATTFVWLPSKTLDFGWLNMFSAPLRGVAENFTAQIATPMVLVTFVTIGAVPVGWFIARGFSAKAAMQVVTMVGVAILGPVFLADPLAEVLSSHGLLVQGRDLGISVAAGLNGNSNPDPNQLVATMQAQMADNFVRRPLQVWNFGHVVDDRPSCKAAWSAGVMAGDEDRVKNGLKACGDSAAYAAADNPSVGQIGAGLLLFGCAFLLLLFAVYMSIKIIWAALDTIYYGFMTIFGFAAGGFVYGPTQTFMVRSVVHGFISAFRMAVFVIFLGLYQLFMGSLFQQARGQVMAVFVIGSIVEIVAIVQLRRLSRSVDGANDWVTNRFALAIQNGLASPGGGGAGGGGRALGMGDANAKNSMGTLGVLAAASTINNSPIAGWLAGRNNPLSRWSRLDHEEKKIKRRGIATKELRAAQHGHLYDRVAVAEHARNRIRGSGAGRNSIDAAAFGAEEIANRSGGGGVAYGLQVAGFNWRRAIKADKIEGDIREHVDSEPLASKHLARVLAGHKIFEANYENPEWSRETLGGLRAHVARYREHNRGGVGLDPHLEALGRQYLDNPSKRFIDILEAQADGAINFATDPHLVANGQPLSQLEADRLKGWIASEHALRVDAHTRWVAEDPHDFERIRSLRSEIDKAAQTDQWQSGRAVTGSNSLPQPDYVARPLEVIPNRFMDDARNNNPTR
ncbi:hypothetical protein AB0M45_32655 [Nocardia sp. NPDC051787]|uniref:hypothetical protein n=1 Tax=Nocardia sp. NPDC051787 TaxID=3155415 RepID=UPI00341E29FF